MDITRCFTRREDDWSSKFSTVTAAVAKLAAQTFILDAETVIETKFGDTDFNQLQKYVCPREPPPELIPHLVYYAFDILYLDGFDLRDVPLTERTRCSVSC